MNFINGVVNTPGSSSPSTPATSTGRSRLSPTYLHYTDKDILKEVSRRGFTSPYATPLCGVDRNSLIGMLKRDDYSTHPYLQWKNYELESFIRRRNLVAPGYRVKDNMVKVLEQADEDFSLPILDLPTEIRCMIFEYAMADPIKGTVKIPKKYMPRIDRPAKASTAVVVTRGQKRPQHALTLVSRLVRQESLYSLERLEQDPEKRRQAVTNHS